MTDSTDTSDLTPDGEGTPMGEAMGSLPGADWEGHDGSFRLHLEVGSGDNAFEELAKVLESSRSEWSEEDTKDALRRALTGYDG